MGEVVLASSGMVIQAGGIFELPIKVDRPSVLRIRFEVDEGYDVDFSLKFLEDAEGSTAQTVRTRRRACGPGRVRVAPRAERRATPTDGRDPRSRAPGRPVARSWSSLRARPRARASSTSTQPAPAT